MRSLDFLWMGKEMKRAWTEVAKPHLDEFGPRTAIDEKNVDFGGFDLAAIMKQAKKPILYTGWQSLVIVMMLTVLMLLRHDPASSKHCFGIHKSSAIIWTLSKRKTKPKSKSGDASKPKSKTKSKKAEEEKVGKEEKEGKRIWSLVHMKETVKSLERCRRQHAASLLTLSRQHRMHQNLLLFHMHDKTAVRLDPHGRSSEFYDTSALDDRLKLHLKKLGWTYMGNPLQTCNRFLLQRIENKEVRDNPELREGQGGFCGAWSIYLFHMAHTHPHLSNSELIELSSQWLLDAKARGDISTVHEFIKGYSHAMMLFAGDLMNSTWIDRGQGQRASIQHPYYPGEYDSKEFLELNLPILLSQLA